QPFTLDVYAGARLLDAQAAADEAVVHAEQDEPEHDDDGDDYEDDDEGDHVSPSATASAAIVSRCWYAPATAHRRAYCYGGDVRRDAQIVQRDVRAEARNLLSRHDRHRGGAAFVVALSAPVAGDPARRRGVPLLG